MIRLLTSRVWLLALTASLLISSCGEEEDDTRTGTPGTLPDNLVNPIQTTDLDPNTWLIPRNEVLDGGPGKDGIPALDQPKRESVTSASSFMLDDDLIIGYKSGDQVVGYPHKILDWHEIINDEVGADKVAITYCPLTGTGIGYSRLIDGNETTFGVSGLLYNTNLIPYDRLTDSNWSQILRQSVNGTLIGRDVETRPIIETKWSTWRELYPDSDVIGTDTGFARNYDRYPYGTYRNSTGLFFPVSMEDARLNQKERVLGVINGNTVIAYPVRSFAVDEVIEDHIDDVQFSVYGSASKDLVVAFLQSSLNLETISLTPIESDGAGVVQDQFGNIYDAFGTAIEGPDLGHQLTMAHQMMGFWFTFSPFFDVVGIGNM